MVLESGKMLTIFGMRKHPGGGNLSNWNLVNLSGFPRSSALDPSLTPRVLPTSLKGRGEGAGEARVKVCFFSLHSFLSAPTGRGDKTRDILLASFGLTAVIYTDSPQSLRPQTPDLSP